MQVHERAVVLVDLAGVDEDAREVEAVLDVGAAAAPLPPVGGELPLQLKHINTSIEQRFQPNLVSAMVWTGPAESWVQLAPWLQVVWMTWMGRLLITCSFDLGALPDDFLTPTIHTFQFPCPFQQKIIQ